MITAQDVRNVTFGKSVRGYSVEQVDEFLDRAAEQLDQGEAQLAELGKKNDALQAQVDDLNKKLEGYVSYEDALKAALLNAQRMGENVIREAKQKADSLVREASIRADDIVRAAESKTEDQKIELERVKSEVAQFKSNVLSLYKAHIESLSTLPEKEQEAPADEVLSEKMPTQDAETEIEPAPEEAVEETASVQPAEPDTESLPQEPTEIVPEPSATESAAEQETASPADDFWEQDEHSLADAAPLTDEPQKAEDSEQEPEQEHRSAFQGISFSD